MKGYKEDGDKVENKVKEILKKIVAELEMEDVKELRSGRVMVDNGDSEVEIRGRKG